MMGRIQSVVLVLLAAGCSVQSPYNRSYVSKGIKDRTGYELGQIKEPNETNIPEGVSLEDGLSEDEAVAIALWNNAQFQADLEDLGFTRADLIEANMLPNPAFYLLFPVGPKLLETELDLPIEALWQRPSRVAVAKLNARRVSENLVEHGLGLIRDVQTTYTDLWLAQQRVGLAEEDVRLQSQMDELAQSRLRAGDISGLATSEVHVNWLQATDVAKTASKEAAILRHRLNTLLGLVSNDVRYNIIPLKATPKTGLSIDKLLKTALAARPDLRGAELEIEAAGKRLGWERSKVYNFIAIIDAKDEGEKSLKIGPAFNVEIPVLNQNNGGIARAKAEMEQAARQYEAVRQNIMLQVRQAYTEYAAAHNQFDLWNNKIVPSLESTLKQTEEAQAVGETSYLSVLEARGKLIEAHMRRTELAAQMHRAAAELNYSVGKKITS